MMMWNKKTAEALKPQTDDVRSLFPIGAEPEGPRVVERAIRPDSDDGEALAPAAAAPIPVPASGVPAVNLHDSSPEYIAYQLFLHICDREQKSFTPAQGRFPIDRHWILETYAQCIRAVKYGHVDAPA